MSFADILVPEHLVLLNEVLHYLVTLQAIDDFELDPARSKVVLRSLESTVFADYHFGILYSRIAPLHISQGDRVEYSTALW